MSKKKNGKQKQGGNKTPVQLMKIEGIEGLLFPLFVAVGEGDYVDTSQLESPVSYVLTGSGLAIYRDSGVFEVLNHTKDGVAGLPEVKSGLTFRFQSIPRKTLEEVTGFFRWASKERHAEAIVLPYYNQSTGEWLMYCPEQEASAGNVTYEPPPPGTVPDGFVRLGTWHSHHTMSAYHSSVDVHDEEKDDGLHITSGRIESADIEVIASAVMYGTRWVLNPADIFAGVAVATKEIAASIGFMAGVGRVASPDRTEFSLVLNNAGPLPFPEEWKTQHKKKVIAPPINHYSTPSYSPPGVQRIGVGCHECMSYTGDYAMENMRIMLKSLKTSDVLFAKVWACADFVSLSGVMWSKDNFDLLEQLKEDFIKVVNEERKMSKHSSVSIAPKDVINVIRVATIPAFAEHFEKVASPVNSRQNGMRCVCAGSKVDKNLDIYEHYQIPSQSPAKTCSTFEPGTGWGWTFSVVRDKYVELGQHWLNEQPELYEQDLDEDTGVTGAGLTEKELGEITCGDCSLFWGLFDSSGNYCTSWKKKREQMPQYRDDDMQIIADAYSSNDMARACTDFKSVTD